MVGSSNNQIGVTPVKDEGARKQEEAGKVFGSDSCDRRAPHSVQLWGGPSTSGSSERRLPLQEDALGRRAGPGILADFPHWLADPSDNTLGLNAAMGLGGAEAGGRQQTTLLTRLLSSGEQSSTPPGAAVVIPIATQVHLPTRMGEQLFSGPNRFSLPRGENWKNEVSEANSSWHCRQYQGHSWDSSSPSSTSEIILTLSNHLRMS